MYELHITEFALQDLDGIVEYIAVKQIRDLLLKYKLRMEDSSMDHKYEIIIFWSEEDKSYVAEIPELPGCMADGPTYQDALANAEQIVREWIETASELGRAIPKPRGRLAYA